MEKPHPDPLSIFLDKELCPTCGALSPRNLSRCPECGTFHRQDVLIERPVTSEMEAEAARHLKPADPEMYSLNPKGAMPTEGDDDDIPDVTTGWDGSSANFNFSDDSTRAPALLDRRKFLDSIKTKQAIENPLESE